MKKKIVVWLDDVRNPSDIRWANEISKYGNFSQIVWCDNYFKFKSFVEQNFDIIDHICFDHDIASFKDNIEFTGYNAAKFLIDYCCDNNKVLPGFSCHSDNVPGRDHIITILNNFKKFQKDER